MENFDVAIVGAGPAGSATAICLARRGFSVALIDKERFPREKLCGDFLNPVSWPILDELRVKERILSQEHEKISAFRITSVAGEAATIPLPANGGELLFGLGLRRASLDQVLLQGAEREGATIFQSCRVKGLKRDGTEWSLDVDVKPRTNKPRAKVVVGADGRNSWVAHHIGVGGSTKVAGGYVGFELHLRNRIDVGQNVEIHLFHGGYAGLVRLDKETINLCFAVNRSKLPEHVSFAALSNHYLASNPYLRDVLRRSDPLSDLRSTYPLHFAPRRCYGDGFLLVGDAARVTEPVTGEGVYFALRSGMLAAEAIDSALRENSCSAEKLRMYDRACRRAFRRRWIMNALVRMLIYRPALVSVLLRISVRRRRWLDAMVHFVCTTQAVR